MLWKNRVAMSVVAAGAISAAAFGGVSAATNGSDGGDAVAAPAVSAVVETAEAPGAVGPASFGAGPQTAQFNEDGEGPRGSRGSHGPRNGPDISGFLGVAPEELREQFQAGATPAEIAAANGSSGDALIAFLLGEAQTRLDEAVANGGRTQAEADEHLARITERVATFVNEGPQQGPREGARPGRHHRGPARAIGTAAEVIGVEPRALFEGIRAGDTVAEIAVANGSSGQAVVDALVANATEHVNQAVADGRITAEEGAERLAQASEHAQTFVFETPQPGERPQRPAGAPAGFGAGFGGGNGDI